MACKHLGEYATFTERAGRALAGRKTETEKAEAMQGVIEACIRDHILEDFLQENREDIVMKYIWEYDEKLAMEAAHEEGYDEGWLKGREEGIDQGIKQGIDQGIDQGRLSSQLENIRNLMDSMDMDAEKVMELMKLSAKEKEKLRKLL